MYDIHHDFLLSGLNPEQEQAVLHDEGPCLVLAAPGSGKTRCLVHRIAYLVLVRDVEQRRILATTFSRKAAGEMRTRLAKLGVPNCDVRTFHSLSAQILRREFPGFDNWDLNETRAEGFVKDACGYKFLKIERVDIQEMTAFIGLCKADMAEPRSERALEIARKVGRSMRPADMIAGFEKSEELRIDGRVMTFDDWLVAVVKIFDSQPDTVERWASKFDYVLQDEANDESLVQARIMRHLAGAHRNYMVVGDPFQSLFSFRGARTELLLGFEAEWEAKVIRMVRNYRSGFEIISLANGLLVGMKDPSTPIVPEKETPGQIDICQYRDQEDEADMVVKQIVESHTDGSAWKDNVILYRMNSLSRAVEEALIKAKVPYHIFGGTNFFARREVRDLLAYLRLACKRATVRDARRCINRPNRFLGTKFLESMEAIAATKPAGGWMEVVESAAENSRVNARQRESAENWVMLLRSIQQDVVNTDPMFDVSRPDKLIHRISSETGYLDWIRKEEGRDTIENDRISNVAELERAAGMFANAKDFLDHVDGSIAATAEAAKDADASEADRVHLMSAHRSKGLEYQNVFLITCNEGVMPHVRGDLEEEKRIFYVSVTRAIENLHISCVEQAVSKGMIRQMSPSCFIEDRLRHPDGVGEMEMGVVDDETYDAEADGAAAADAEADAAEEPADADEEPSQLAKVIDLNSRRVGR